MDLQHCHNTAMMIATKIATRMTERVVYGGIVKNNDMPDKDEYFNFKQ
jgi:hypothetical protein